MVPIKEIDMVSASRDKCCLVARLSPRAHASPAPKWPRLEFLKWRPQCMQTHQNDWLETTRFFVITYSEKPFSEINLTWSIPLLFSFWIQEVTVVMFFRQHWIDTRLAYGPSLGIQKIKLLGNIVDQVWLPDIYFVNDLSDKTTCGDFLFEVTQEGIITHSCRSFNVCFCFGMMFSRRT